MSCSVSLQQLVEQTLAQETREKRCDSCQHEEDALSVNNIVDSYRSLTAALSMFQSAGVSDQELLLSQLSARLHPCHQLYSPIGIRAWSPSVPAILFFYS